MKHERRWVRVTPVDSIPLREGRSAKIGGRDIAIFNLGDRFLAVENRCPHRGGPLADGIISGSTVVCPLHAWKIDLASGSVTNQAADAPCVEAFRTRVENGVIAIELSAVGSEAIVSPACPGSVLQNSCSNQITPSEA